VERQVYPREIQNEIINMLLFLLISCIYYRILSMYNNVQNNKSAKLAKLNTHYEYLLMSGVVITRPF